MLTLSSDQNGSRRRVDHRFGRLPLLTTSLTRVPIARFAPGLGVCESTWPLLTCCEKALLTFPTEQCAPAIARFAPASPFPFTLGTRQVQNLAVTERFLSIFIVHGPVPAQGRDQPTNFERSLAVALSVTEVPSAKSCRQLAPSMEGSL